jgi:hypothetical protein
MKGGYVYLGFQLINFIMNDSNQLNKFWYKPKRNIWLLIHSKMTYSHLECQNPIKKSNNIFFGTHISYTSFQTFQM